MKNPKCVVVFLAMMGLAGLVLGAGCGPHAAPAAVPDPISVNTLDGSEGVPVDSTFRYVFSRPVNTLTVTASTFFIVKNDGICDSTQALDVSVGCSSPAECTLTTADLLEYSSNYSICLAGNMQYATGEQFGNVRATFTAEAEGPLSLNSLDGTVDVPVDSSFRYRFLKEVDTSTVDTSTYFIVPTVDPATCDSANAVASEITCTRWSCIIAPSAYLEYITGYTARLTSNISYTSSFEFNGFMASFTTTEWIISSIKLVRLDGTELELSDCPIPRKVGVRVVLSVAVSDESERTALEEAVQLLDPDNIAVDGSWTWVDDFTSATFMPARRLEYRTEYSIDINAGIIPLPSLTRALENQDLAFTTMTDRDINGDGYADVIVGAEGYNGGNNKGQAYIYLGLASGISNCDLSDPTCIPDATIAGGNNGDIFGTSVSTTGDINADGYADIIVGARGFDGGKGQAYIFLGGSQLSEDLGAADADATITGKTGGDALGFVSTAGDINADGYDDIIVAAPAFDTNTGQVYIFLGGPPLSGNLGAADADATITGGNNEDLFGTVSNAGDVNGDGYDDIIVGAEGFDGGKGQAYIFLGGSQLSGDLSIADADATITGKTGEDALAFVSTAGDINADRYDDIIVGAPGYNGLKGQAYIFLGGSQLSGDLGADDADATITGENGFDILAFVSTAGDINADGYDDIIVGAVGFDSGNLKGQAYIFLGGSQLSGDLSIANADATITGKTDGDRLGYSASTTGDINADGYDDIIVGAIGYDSTTGQAYILMGSGSGISDCNMSPPISCTADSTLTGAIGDDMFGIVKQNWLLFE